MKVALDRSFSRVLSIPIRPTGIALCRRVSVRVTFAKALRSCENCQAKGPKGQWTFNSALLYALELEAQNDWPAWNEKSKQADASAAALSTSNASHTRNISKHLALQIETFRPGSVPSLGVTLWVRNGYRDFEKVWDQLGPTLKRWAIKTAIPQSGWRCYWLHLVMLAIQTSGICVFLRLYWLSCRNLDVSSSFSWFQNASLSHSR